MAEGIARKLLSPNTASNKQIHIFSAGVAAAEGSGATQEAARAAASLGVDIGAHRSLPLTREMITGASMIFAMTNAHVRAIVDADPSAKNKTFTLDPSGEDIPDPIGFAQDVYDQTAAAISRAIEQRAGLIVGR